MRIAITPPVLIAGLALAAACAAGACGGKSNTNQSPMDAGDDGLAFATCLEAHADKGVMPYMPGVIDTSNKGTYTVTLVSNQPGAPADAREAGPEVKGVNTWSISVADGAAAPVDGLEIIAMPYMPDHRHGTSINAVTTGMGGGSYQITPLYLYMTGYWEITLNLQAPAAADADGGAPPPAETVMFTVCIP